MTIDCNEAKRLKVLQDREIDLRGMKWVFDGRQRFTYQSVRNGEDRNVTIAELDGKLHAVIWMWRDEVIWVITARRAWKKEERKYLDLAARQGGRDGRQDKL